MTIDDIVEVLDDLKATISDVEIEADNWADARKAKRLQPMGRKDGNSFDVQEPVQEVLAFKQKLAKENNVISGHLNPPKMHKTTKFLTMWRTILHVTPQLLY